MRIGLISDTHMPQRYKAIPETVFTIFADCDVILHAGDVGELWVLDHLSQCAPVIAVHGNDETEAAQNALPFLQTMAFAGHRVVMTHSHYPDFSDETENRKDDRWQPKLQYRADFGKAHGASIVITGHTHIPMQVVHDDILLINPGAIASGGGWTKQTLQTVAILTLEADTTPSVRFIDINTQADYVPEIDWLAGFIIAARKTFVPIVSDELAEVRLWFREHVFSLYPDYFRAKYLPLCHAVWAGERDIIQLTDVIKILTESDAPPEIMDILRQNETFAEWSHSK